MKKLNRTGTVLAIAVASYCGTATAQECETEIQELRSQIQERQLGAQQEETIQDLLGRAERAGAGTCQQYVTQARQQLDDPRMQQAQASDDTTDVQVEQGAADIEVDAGAPEVAVKQQPPQVQVQRQAPEVEVRQPETEVEVQQAEPEVVVNQAEPEVEVQQSEPQVEIKQAGEPEVSVVQADEQSGAGTEPQGATSSVAASSTGQISDDEAAELTGKTAISSDGEEIGDISAVVRSQTGNDLHAVVDVGGFLGIGERTVAIPLQKGEINEEGDLRLSATREELEQMPEYDPQQYQQFGLVQ